jgi:hypothetical protein
MERAIEKGEDLKLKGVLGHMQCHLIVHGGHDVLGVKRATKVYEYAKEHGIDMTTKVLSE